MTIVSITLPLHFKLYVNRETVIQSKNFLPFAVWQNKILGQLGQFNATSYVHDYFVTPNHFIFVTV